MNLQQGLHFSHKVFTIIFKLHNITNQPMAFLTAAQEGVRDEILKW